MKTNENTTPGAELPSVRSEPLLGRHDLICILQEHLTVTDEWGGCKLASWQYGYNVLVDGIDEAADAILSRLSNASVSISGDEPEYAPRTCSPSFLAEVERIANDYIPDNDSQAPLALFEMRAALQSLLANAKISGGIPSAESDC